MSDQRPTLLGFPIVESDTIEMPEIQLTSWPVFATTDDEIADALAAGSGEIGFRYSDGTGGSVTRDGDWCTYTLLTPRYRATCRFLAVADWRTVMPITHQYALDSINVEIANH